MPKKTWKKVAVLDKNRTKYAAQKRSSLEGCRDDEPPAQRQRALPTEQQEPLPPMDTSTDTPDSADDITTALQDEAISVITHEHVRIAIAVYYVNVMGRPSKDEWQGEGGVMSSLVNALKLNSRKTVMKVLEEVEQCFDLGREFVGGRKPGSGGQNKCIQENTPESRLIAACTEDGPGVKEGYYMVNEYRSQRGLPLVGQSAIYSAFHRLHPVITKIKALKQGNNDEDSVWAQCRYGWALQLRLRMAPDVTCLVLGPEHQPAWFDRVALPTLSVNQIVFWDETHRKAFIGASGIGGSMLQVRFHRDDDGALDPAGTLAPSKWYLATKYSGEMRLGLGCAAVNLGGGVIVGRCAEVFSYTERTIVSIPDYDALVKKENSRVNALSSGGADWLLKTRQPGHGLYEDDPLTILPGVGPKFVEQLAPLGSTVGQVKQRTLSDVVTFAKSTRGVGLARLQGLWAACQRSQHGVCPFGVIDFRRAPNPYEAKYGRAWRAKIALSSTLRGVVCITELVEHIVSASAAVMADTIYANDWVFYHDALSLMTAKATTEWMKTNDYYKRWLLPVEGLNHGTTYEARPVGNSPEMMPWDCSLNKDVHDAFDRHRALTDALPAADPKKFSSATPRLLEDGYRRLLEKGVPTSQRIVGDITKCMGKNLDGIIAAKGVVVQGLGNRTGIRYQAMGKGHGGYRAKSSEFELPFTHADAVDARAATYQECTAT
jgi:hypothetical protein